MYRLNWAIPCECVHLCQECSLSLVVLVATYNIECFSCNNVRVNQKILLSLYCSLYSSMAVFYGNFTGMYGIQIFTNDVNE